MFMIDLFAGMGGASRAMRERGWRVVRVEIDPKHRPDVVADARFLPLRDGLSPDLLWMSPVCTEFARESMPWCRTGSAPSLELVQACLVAVDRLKPRWWVIENVRGAQKWLNPILGRPTQRIGAQYLWGRFPLLLGVPAKATKERIGPCVNRAALRSEAPYALSLALARQCEAFDAAERGAA